MLLPSVEGQKAGKWIVIDSGIIRFFSLSIMLMHIIMGSFCLLVIGCKDKIVYCFSSIGSEMLDVRFIYSVLYGFF